MADELTKVVEDSVRGSFFLISGTVIATIILAIGSIIIARILNPELYGQYSLALVVPQLLFLFADLGMNQGITKFTAELQMRGETSRLAKIIQHGLLLRALTGVVIFLINYVFADVFASIILQRPELAFFVRISSISVLFQVIFTTATSAFVGVDKTEYNALATNVQAISKTIIQVVLVLLGFAVAGAIAGHVISYLVAGVIGVLFLYLMLRKEQNTSSGQSFAESAKVLLRYGTPLYISTLLVGFVPFFQSVVLALFTTDADIGNYKAAINFATLLTVFAVPITTAMLPAFSKLNSATEQKIRAFFKLANKYTAVIILPATFLMIMFSNEIVRIIYGSDYQSASLFLTTYCLLYFLVGFGYLTLSSFYNGIGETKTTLKISAITFIILVILSPLLTNAYGVQGLIAAFLLASATGQIYASYYARKKFQITFDNPTLIKIYAISALSTAIPLLISNFTNFPSFLVVALGGVSYLFSYVTLMPLTRVVTPSELRQAMQIVQNIPIIASIARPVLKYQQKMLTRN